MEIETYVSECCGLNSLFYIPKTLKDFKNDLLYAVDNNEVDGEFKGALVFITLDSTQKSQLVYLQKIGFIKARPRAQKNSRSKNTIHLLTITVPQINKLIKKWDRE